MQTTQLGNTGLTVSVAGLGCGGNSRLGMARGASQAESMALIREAIALGVNFFDTAENYGTEAIVGDALSGLDRTAIVLSTKTQIRRQGELLPATEIAKRIDQSLQRLKTDYVDVFHLHGVMPDDYEFALAEIAPILVRAKEAGKIRHIGITESSPRDPYQTMLQHAVDDRPWEVVMLAFNMMNQLARKKVLPLALERGLGTLIMFAVRNVFSKPDVLRNTLTELAQNGSIPKELANEKEPLAALIAQAGASSVTDAAYRYARHQPGVDVVLFGTGSRAHLASNIESINKPPLDPAAVERIQQLFSDLVGVGLDLPDRFKPT